MSNRFAMVLALASLFLVGGLLAAERRATTDDGTVVLLRDDGTWVTADQEAQASKESSAQPLECSEVVKVETDRVSGTSLNTIEPIIVENPDKKSGIGIRLLDTGKKTIILSFIAVGASRCIDKSSKINILLRDQTRIELANDADFNCKGQATVYLGGTFGKTAELKQLRAGQIETIRVWTSDSFVQADLSPEQSKVLQRAFECMAN